MDLVLNILDNFVLDRVWATLVPLSAFATPDFVGPAANASSLLPIVATTSKWSRMVAYLPHPPLRPDDMAFVRASSSQNLTNISAWPRDYVPRQLLSLAVITMIGIHILYFAFAGLSYYFVFNHEMMKHPRFLKNQVRMEIQTSVRAFPGMLLLTLPWFQAEVMGYSRLYDGLDTYGYAYLIFSVPL